MGAGSIVLPVLALAIDSCGLQCWTSAQRAEICMHEWGDGNAMIVEYLQSGGLDW